MNELSRNFQPLLTLPPAARVQAGGVQAVGGQPAHVQAAHIDVLTGDEVKRCRRWPRAFAGQRKDHRFYEIVERTIRQAFDYRYFALRDAGGEVRAVAPFIVLDQDLSAGLSGMAPRVVAALRRLWPRLMIARTLMVGCAAGEGHLDAADELPHEVQAQLLLEGIPAHAERLGASLVVFKEFPAIYRGALAGLVASGYTRVPSYPMTRLDIGYPSFEAYMAAALSRKTRRDLRVKFRAAATNGPISLSVVEDITPLIDEAYPLYLQVFARARFRFETLTPEFLCELGRRMPDKVRYFVWRRAGRMVAFSLCMVDGEDVTAEYLGLDYAVALDLTSTIMPSATW